MKKLAITLTAITTLLMSGSTATANDLVKALSTLQRLNRGPAYGSNYRTAPRGDVYTPVRRTVVVTAETRDVGCDDRVRTRSHRSVALEKARLRALERAEKMARLERLANLKRLERLDRERSRHASHSRVSFRVGVQDNFPVLPPPPVVAPPVYTPQIPVLPPAPVYPPVYVEPAPVLPAAPRHCFGDIVTCQVPVYKRVRVRDRHNIACNARPMTVAIKSPSACGHTCNCCADEISYVTVMAPPCEPQFVKVSPCGRKIRMDFGKYEIDVVSTNPNFIKVDYDN